MNLTERIWCKFLFPCKIPKRSGKLTCFPLVGKFSNFSQLLPAIGGSVLHRYRVMMGGATAHRHWIGMRVTYEGWAHPAARVPGAKAATPDYCDTLSLVGPLSAPR